MTRDNSKFELFVAFIAAIAGLLFGYDMGIISGAAISILQDFQLPASMHGVVISAVLLGAVVGAMVAGFLSNQFGRRQLLMIVAMIFALGSIMAAFSSSIPVLISARVILGVAIGVASYAAPLYIAEIASSGQRGAMVALNQLAIAIGILLSYIVAYYFIGRQDWRFVLGIGVIPALILLIGMVWLPYSPRWMVLCGRNDKALAILRQLRGFWVNVNDEANTIMRSMTLTQSTSSGLMRGMLIPALIIAGGLAMFQQIMGVYTFIYYAPFILKLAGFQSLKNVMLAVMGIGIVMVLFTCVAILIIDRIGRRPLLFIGLAGMSICLILMSFSFTNALQLLQVKWLIYVSFLSYFAFFSISIGPIMWLMISELYPLRVRGLGSGFATSANWLSALFVAFMFMQLVKWIGITKTLLLFSATSLLAIVFVYYLVPETKGRYLDEINV